MLNESVCPEPGLWYYALGNGSCLSQFISQFVFLVTVHTGGVAHLHTLDHSPVPVLFLLIPVQALEAPLRPPVLTVLAGHTPRESLSRTFCPQKGAPVTVIIMRFFWLGGLKEEGHEVSPAGHRGTLRRRGESQLPSF